MKSLSNRGYTMIQLMIVVAIIGILTTIALPQRSPDAQHQAVASALLERLVPSAQAAPNVPATNPGVVLIPLHISGQYTTSVTSVAKFNMPMPCTLIGVGASARASGGTTPSLTVDVMKAGVSMLSSTFQVFGNYVEGTITSTTAAIADEALVSVNLGISGTSPTWNDITVLLTCVRR